MTAFGKERHLGLDRHAPFKGGLWLTRLVQAQIVRGNSQDTFLGIVVQNLLGGKSTSLAAPTCLPANPGKRLMPSSSALLPIHLVTSDKLTIQFP